MLILPLSWLLGVAHTPCDMLGLMLMYAMTLDDWNTSEACGTSRPYRELWRA